MAVFAYTATIRGNEDAVESGTVLALSEEEALWKLQVYQLEDVKLKRLKGLPGFLKGFTADIK